MGHPILDGRHTTTLDFSNHFIQFCRPLVPVRKIECPPGFDHVIVNQPRTGRDTAIPRPLSFIAVTLKTMILGHLARFRAVPLGLLNNGRVGMVAAKGNQLQYSKNDHASNYEVDQNLFHIFFFWGVKTFLSDCTPEETCNSPQLATPKVFRLTKYGLDEGFPAKTA